MKNFSKELKKILFIGLIISLIPFLSTQKVLSSGGEGVSNNTQETTEIENVILMIGDGLGMGQMEVARALEHGKEGQFHMEQMEDVGLMKTYSNDYHVTDSAAAGTAIASSQKTNNGMVGMTPEGEPVQTILQAFKEAGKNTGIVTNHSITDATPAAFTAHVEDRDEHEEIARQQYDNQYDVLLGGGLEHFLPEAQDGENLIEAFEEDGYQVVQNREELMNIDYSNQLLGLFADEHMALETDRDYLSEAQPSLSEMSKVALEGLTQDDNGFFLMIESARIDHAAHYGDVTNVWKETVEFDYTVEQVKEWAEDRDDTLVVVTSDHETMGMSMTEVMDVESLREVSASPEYMVEQFEYDEENNQFTDESIQAVVSEHAGFELSEEDMERLNTHLYEDDGSPRDEWDQAVELGLIIAEHFNADFFNRENTEKSVSTVGHSGNMVPIFASGVGSDHFNAVLDNTELSKIIAEQADVSFGEHHTVSESTSDERAEVPIPGKGERSDSQSGIDYPIVWGDTLWNLAQNYDTSVNAIANDNHIKNPDLIYAGNWLTIAPGFVTIAHRGASGYAPEHTIPAYDLATEMNGDYLELDVQITADEELVVFHDDDISRTTNGEGEIGDYTLEELKELDAGTWFNEENPEKADTAYEGLTILTVEEVLERYGLTEQYYIETKSPEINENMEEPLVNILEKYNLVKNGNVIIQSFSQESLKHIHNLNEDIPLVQLLAFEMNEETGEVQGDTTPAPENMTTEDFEEIRDYAIGIGPNFTDDNDNEVFDRDFVQEALNHNLIMHPYTVNDQEDMERVIDWGVTGIFTDYPDRLNELLN